MKTTLLTFMIVIGFAVAIVAFFVVRGSEEARLRRRGLSGVGRVISIQQIPSAADAATVLNVTLDVTPHAGPGFQAVARFVEPPKQASRLQTGRQVMVKYDPGNRSKIVIVSDER